MIWEYLLKKFTNDEWCHVNDKFLVQLFSEFTKQLFLLQARIFLKLNSYKLKI